MFLKGTLTSRKDQSAANSEEEVAAVAADTVACMAEAATVISVSDAVDTAEAAAVAADAGIRAAGIKEEEEEEGSLPSTFIFY